MNDWHSRCREAVHGGGMMVIGIQVYGADWCSLTFGLREYLTNARLPYDYYNIERDPAADEFVRALNGGRRRFPILVVEDSIVTNPTPSQVEQALDHHHLRRVSVLRTGPRAHW